MAIEFKKVKKDLNEAPLSREEMDIINKVEKWIDKEIKESFDNGCVRILLPIADFSYNPYEDEGWNPYKLKDGRRYLMKQELEKRYNRAGWNCKNDYDDGLDGPNMAGPDYWVLTGK